VRVLQAYDGHEEIYEGKGSLPRIVWNVASRVAARGHDVTVVERQWEGLPRRASYEGVRFRRLALGTASDVPWAEPPYEMVNTAPGLAKMLVDRTNFALKTARLIRQGDFDVAHFYLPFAANVLVTLAPWWRDRMVYTAQLGELRLNALSETEGDTPDVPEAIRYFSPDVYLAKRAGHTTVLNENVRKIFAANGVPESRLTHVPNGVSISKFDRVTEAGRERVREQFGLDGSKVIFFAGTIMPRKGVAELVRAVDRVVNDHGVDDVRLVLAGETGLDEQYMQRVRSLIAEGGLNDRVVFPGYLTDETLLPLYSASDVFVLPSFEEGFGMVVSEAMATGTPAIGSRISGIDQQIDDGRAGVLVEPGNVDGLAAALADLLGNPQKRHEMGERCRERAQRFSWESVTDQYIDIYRRLGT
jgi:glycosyltransferase involved in cell wall biosynthesis